MIEIPYNFIEAKNEKELREKLLVLTANSGFTFKIISIYKKGKGVVAWYYSSKRTS